ncbi:hypothetical protein JTB14_027055 [Gonioctena quinquepunctata]|nr:hypothetical protein JTB14_027055 [Gonioctena quinquepunctata]
MMATKQQTGLNLSISGDLVAECVKSVTLPKKFTNSMIRCSILNILHHRFPLEESELTTRKYKNIPFVVLRNVKSIKDPLLTLYLYWIDGIEDAFDKNYLKDIFVLMKNLSGEVIETYHLKLKYNTDPDYENQRTLVHVQDDITTLLQVLCDIEKNEKLDRDNIKLVIELTYSEETPAEYEPPGFELATKPNCVHTSVFEKSLDTLTTGFRKFICRTHGLTAVERILPTTSPVEEKENKGACANENTLKDDKTLDEKLTIEADKTGPTKPLKTVPQKFNINNLTISDRKKQCTSILSNYFSEYIVPMTAYMNCICQLVIPFEVDIIRCSRCDRQYHAPCHGYLNKGLHVVNFLCIHCDTTDKKLTDLDGKDREIFIRVRLMLYFLEKYEHLPDEIVNSLGESYKQVVLDKLQQLEIYEDKNFNKINLEESMSMFFNIDDPSF